MVPPVASSPARRRPLIGRPELMEALRHRRDQARAGHACLTILEGEAGVGKSAVLDILAEEAREAGFRVLRARARALESPPPLELLREALDESPAELVSPGARATPAGGLAAALVDGPAPRSVGPAFPVALGVLPWGGVSTETEVDDGADHLVEAIRTPGTDTETGRLRLFGGLSDRLRTLAEGGPVLLALDDLYAADESSLEFLRHLAETFDGSLALWIVGTTRPIAELPEDVRWTHLEGLLRDPRVERLAVRPLTAKELVEFVRWRDPTRVVPSGEYARWHSQTGGNPLFLEQLLRGREPADGGADGTGEGDASGGALRRLAALPEAEYRVLSLAAVLGKEFPFALLWKASGEADEERLAELVERLVAAGFLREKAPETLEFVRDDVRARIYSHLTETRRRVLHKRAGESLEGFARSDAASVYALARHFYLGRADAKAVEYNRKAADIATRAFAPHMALPHLERALECERRLEGADPGQELDLGLRLAVQLDHVGELEHAERVLRELLAGVARHPTAPRGRTQLVRVYLARFLSDQGRWDEARGMTDELLAEVDERTPASVRIALHRLRGEIDYYRGDYRSSLAHHDRALTVARREGDEREVALETVRRANVLGMIPSGLDEALRAYREASDALVRLGDFGEAAFALIFRGVVLSQYGRTDEGLTALDSAARLAERANDLRRLGWAHFNIADLLREKDPGRLEEAAGHNRRSREILTRIGDRFGLAQTYIIEGKIALLAGDLDRAETELEEARRLVRELHAEADELDVLLRLAELALARGDRTAARGHVRELERRDLPRLRPDLAGELRAFTERLDAEP